MKAKTAAKTAKPSSLPTRSGQAPPTLEQFSAYQSAWEYFNKSLFDGTLRPCLLNFSRKSDKCLGFFAAERWSRDGNGDGKANVTHEISLNPDVIKRDIKDTMSTLVHEMVHQWQYDFAKAPRKGYHNKEWADRMESIGLMPSSTAADGGKRTGAKVSHWIIPGGQFENAYEKMPKEFLIPWSSSATLQKVNKSKNKIKYECSCGVNVWGKPELNILCGECDEKFTEQD